MDIEDSSILVTGGAGFVGTQLSDDLLAAGADVHVVDDLSSGYERLVPDTATFSEIDIRSNDIATVVRDYQPDAIVHLAALHYIPFCNESPGQTFDVNVMGTRNVLRATEESDTLEKFVFASSAAVYPKRDEAHVETSTLEPIGIYGNTKLVGEELVNLYGRKLSCDVGAARLFNVFGPNETTDHLIPTIFSQIRGGDREITLGNIKPKRDFVHVSDVSRAFRAILKRHEGDFRAYNVGTNVEHSVREVVEQIANVLGEDITIHHDETRVRENDRMHLKADISRIRDELGWEPEISLESGLKRLVEENVAVYESA